MADAADLKSVAARREGSSPSPGIRLQLTIIIGRGCLFGSLDSNRAERGSQQAFAVPG